MANSFTNWLSGLFGKAKAEEIEKNGYQISSEETVPLTIERTAIQSAVGLIAAAVGQCRFRTFLNGKEKREEEYYLWNYSPNANQSSTQFLQSLAETLVYDNEALVIEQKKQLFIADCFSYTEDGTQETIFTGITVNGEALPDRRAGDVLYFRLSNENVRPLLSSLCHQYEELIAKAVDSYDKAGAAKGILNIDATKRGPIDYEAYQKDLLENKFKKFFSSENAVLPLYAGYTYTPHTNSLRNASELNDVKSMSDEIYNRVGQAFRIPPSLLRGETAQSGDGIDKFLRFCICPLCDIMEEEISRKRYGLTAYKKGSYVSIDTSAIEITGMFASAEKLDKLIGSGILSIDEVREKMGEPLLGTEEAQMHFVTKNYGVVDTEQKTGAGKEGGNE